MKNVPQQLLIAAFLCSQVIAVGGCTGSGPKGSSSWSMPWSKKDKPPKPYPNPVKMAVTWTPDTLVQSGRTPTRGFGGRLFFYDEKTRPVPVAGDLTVHAIAENPDGSVGEVKRYHFTAEQFTEHFSQSDLGASYSIWIPWDAVGGDQMRISLVPSFRTTGGRLVQGEQALVGLPGRRKSTENVAQRPDRISELLAARDASKSGLTTTTIPVRRELGPHAEETDFRSIANSGKSFPAAVLPSASVEKSEPQDNGQPVWKTVRLGQSVLPASAELPLQ
jgi:hypothetical protein